MPHRKLDTPGKASLTADRPESAREWDDGTTLRARLEELIGELPGGSRTAFAKLIGVQTSHVSKWCNGDVLPGAEMLWRIAELTKVSVDWLLGVQGAPKHPRRLRSDTALAADFAEYLEDELTRRQPPRTLVGDESHSWVVIPDRALEAAIDAIEVLARQAAERQARNRESAARFQALKSAFDALVAAKGRKLGDTTAIEAVMTMMEDAIADVVPAGSRVVVLMPTSHLDVEVIPIST
jgi:transcriptional regulator with XRE-family HTH domain